MDLQSNSHLAANSSEYSSKRFFAISFSFRVLSSKSLASASVCNPPQAVCNCDEVAYVINTECWMLSRPKDFGGNARYRVMPYCAGRRLHTRPRGVITCQALRSWIKIKATSKGRLNFWRCHPGIRHRRRYPRSAPDKQACRSSSGVCEPDSATPWACRAQFKSDDTAKEKKNGIPRGIPFSLEVPPRFELGIEVLQTFALPLGYGTVCLMPVYYIKARLFCQGFLEK